jgi:hypothetical protein
MLKLWKKYTINLNVKPYFKRRGVLIISGETLPQSFWIIYYLILLLTLATVIFSIIKKRNRKLSVFALLITIFFPFFGFAYAVQRQNGDELDYLLQGLQNFNFSAFILVFFIIFLLFWWVVFFRSFKTNY